MKMICLCGMPGVGKTTWAKEFLKHNPNYKYFNPDVYYTRINGDDTIRANTFEVWHSMYRDIYIAMTEGKNVLIDSDNLTFHQRMQWIEWFPDFEHYLVYFYEGFDVCFKRVQQRRRKIDIGTLLDKQKKWEHPLLNKDPQYWDKILKGDNINASQLAETLIG